MSGRATDRHGAAVVLGARVRIVSLSGRWLDELPPDEHARVMSMVGEVFEVDEFDDYGHPWVTKAWEEGEDDYCSHSIALDADEMEVVDSAVPSGPA